MPLLMVEHSHYLFCKDIAFPVLIRYLLYQDALMMIHNNALILKFATLENYQPCKVKCSNEEFCKTHNRLKTCCCVEKRP